MAYDHVSPMPAGPSMMTKRIKSSIGAEWAHGSTVSIKPQPPLNEHLELIRKPKPGEGTTNIAKRKHEEMPQTGGEFCWQGRTTPTRYGNVGLGKFLTRPYIYYGESRAELTA